MTADVLAAVDGPFAVAGYSLGGRVALHVALAAPERVTALVLAATTAGIEDPAERAARRASDRAFAERTRAGTLEAFVEAWTGQPLFAGTPERAAADWAADLRRNTPADLADVLLGLSAGVMEPVWDRLGELTMPVEILVGERDAKYRAIGDRLAAAIPDARLTVVPGAGHGLPREAPEAVAAAITAATDRARARMAR